MTRENLAGGLIEHVAPWGGAEQQLCRCRACTELCCLSDSSSSVLLHISSGAKQEQQHLAMENVQ